MRCRTLLSVALLSWAGISQAAVLVANQGGGDAYVPGRRRSRSRQRTEPGGSRRRRSIRSCALNRSIDAHGVDLTIRSVTDPPAVIDCENLGPGFVFASGEQLSSVRESFTILRATDAVRCTGSDNRATLRNLEISASNRGIAADYFTPQIVIENCVVTGCGTGIEISKAVVTDTDVSGCGIGMLIYESSNATITGCSFNGNDAGVLGNPGSPDFTDCSFTNNFQDGFAGGRRISSTASSGEQRRLGRRHRQLRQQHARGVHHRGERRWRGPLPGPKHQRLTDALHDHGQRRHRCHSRFDGSVESPTRSSGATADTRPITTGAGTGGIAVTCLDRQHRRHLRASVFTQDLIQSDPMVCGPVACGSTPDGAGDYQISRDRRPSFRQSLRETDRRHISTAAGHPVSSRKVPGSETSG
ncbi:MAG: right-handed parallel beta-helix repeat-containing protein [Candidatus Eisenbacteria bacterium]